MQTLIVDGKKIEIVRSFHDGVGDPHVCEFSDSSWGYANGEKLGDPTAVGFLPEAHRRRAESWIRRHSKGVKNATKASKQEGELYEMSLTQLQILANDTTTDDKDALVKKIQASAEA